MLRLDDIIICKYFAYILSWTLISLCYAYNGVVNQANECLLFYEIYLCFSSFEELY